MKNIKIAILAFILIFAFVLCSCGKTTPTEEPTAEPTAAPTAEPTAEPTSEPTNAPTSEPTAEPTAEPTEEPTEEPPEEIEDPVGKSLIADNIPFSFYLIAGEDGLARAAIVETWNFAATQIVIPETITYNGHVYPVEQVGQGQNIMPSSPEILRSVVISSSVKVINSSAFAMCGDLSDIVLPEGLEVIGEQAFMGTGIVSLELPSTVKAIGRSAFAMNPDMREVVINIGIVTIGERAFGYLSSLEKVTIPQRFESRISEIFYYCDTITNGTCEITYK